MHVSYTMLAALQVQVPSNGVVTDEHLCQLLKQHLGIDASAQLTAANGADSTKAGKATGSSNHANNSTTSNASSRSNKGSSQPAYKPISVEDFVSVTTRLLELEHQAEVDQAQETSSLCSPETAQVRGVTGHLCLLAMTCVMS